MKRNDHRIKFNDYMKEIRKGNIIDIAYEDRYEISQRCKREHIKITYKFFKDYVQIRRK